jgi:hypothetical protein
MGRLDGWSNIAKSKSYEGALEKRRFLVVVIRNRKHMFFSTV